MPGEKLSQPAHPHLLAEAGADLPGTLQGDAPDLGQLLRGVLNDREGVLSELLNDQPGGGDADALHRAGGQIVVDLLGPLGQAALHVLRLELGAVGGMPGPAAPDGQVLSGGDAGQGAHHGDLLLSQVQAEDGIAVFLVAVDDSGD